MPDPACQLGYSIVGGVLQLIGALFAGVGLWLAYQRLERRPQFLTNTWSAVQALVRTTHGFYLRRIENPLRRWFGKTPRSQTIRASAASSVAIAGSARRWVTDLAERETAQALQALETHRIPGDARAELQETARFVTRRVG